MPTIPLKLSSAKPKRTDLTRLEMLNQSAANITVKLLGMENMATNGKSKKQRIEDWISEYRALSEFPSLDEMLACLRNCPATGLPDAVALMAAIQAKKSAGLKPPHP